MIARPRPRGAEQRIALIWAMGRNRAIGRDGRLPWDLPDDLAHFHDATRGRPVVMGRRTFESMGRPLPGRLNIVLSRRGFRADGALAAANLDAALALARRDPAAECFVIGGAEPYALALPRAHRLHATIVDADVPGDAFFPPFDFAGWRRTGGRRHDADDQHAYAFDIGIFERAH